MQYAKKMTDVEKCQRWDHMGSETDAYCSCTSITLLITFVCFELFWSSLGSKSREFGYCKACLCSIGALRKFEEAVVKPLQKLALETFPAQRHVFVSFSCCSMLRGARTIRKMDGIQALIPVYSLE